MVSYIPFIYSSTFLKMSSHQQKQQLEEPDSWKLATEPTVIIAWTITESSPPWNTLDTFFLIELCDTKNYT